MEAAVHLPGEASPVGRGHVFAEDFRNGPEFYRAILEETGVDVRQVLRALDRADPPGLVVDTGGDGAPRGQEEDPGTIVRGGG